MTPMHPQASQTRSPVRWPPLWLQTVLAMLLGVALGAYAGHEPLWPGFGTEQLSRMGLLVIQTLKVLAVPLVAFVVLDSLLTFDIPARQGLRLLRFCSINAAVAMSIALALSNWLKPGALLRPLFEPLLRGVREPAASVHAATTALHSLDALDALAALIPKSIAGPFVDNAVVPAALLALLLGIALRKSAAASPAALHSTAFQTVRAVVHLITAALQCCLGWIVHLAPLAAFGLVAHAVASAGLSALVGLWVFLACIALGFVLHGLVYYPSLAWLLGKRAPWVFLPAARDAVITGIAANSSLAAVPVTLRCIVQGLGVSDTSARISTCLGANLNHDGIALYEAMAALAITQALGLDLDFAQQLTIVAASVLAGVGIAGIPEAGIVLLPTVLSAAGLPPEVALAAVPLVMPVDWILARARTAMNVLSDILVALLLDREPPLALPETAVAQEFSASGEACALLAAAGGVSLEGAKGH